MIHNKPDVIFRNYIYVVYFAIETTQRYLKDIKARVTSRI